MMIILTGAGGQLGTALQHVLQRAGHDVVPLERSRLDITRAEEVQAVLASVKPAAVINAAAYNFVDQAEEEPEKALAVNALGPRNLARFCAAHDIPLVHVSTDYVFSGTADALPGGPPRRVPYAETDSPAPLSAYGVSKRAGELFVRSLCRRHFILRTCGLYGSSRSAGKGNFVTTMLRLARQHRQLRVVDDQCCTPTSAADLAEWIARLLSTEAYGLYHATNSGSTSWCGFAREIFRQAGVETTVIPITTAEYGAKAARPPYSVLNGSRLEGVLGRKLRPWQEALADFLPQVL